MEGLQYYLPAFFFTTTKNIYLLYFLRLGFISVSFFPLLFNTGLIFFFLHFFLLFCRSLLFFFISFCWPERIKYALKKLRANKAVSIQAQIQLCM